MDNKIAASSVSFLRVRFSNFNSEKFLSVYFVKGGLSQGNYGNELLRG